MVTGPLSVIMEGIRDADNAQQRLQGAEKAFGENSDIRVVASESANWKIDEAYALAQTLFAEHPNIKLIFCANDMMGLGVIHYLQEAGRRDVLVAGFDNLEDFRSTIREGWAAATVDQQAEIQGYTGVVTAVNILDGQSVDDETYIEAKVITKEDLNQ
jgi:ribose transport system substrate-binding protein